MKSFASRNIPLQASKIFPVFISNSRQLRPSRKTNTVLRKKKCNNFVCSWEIQERKLKAATD